MLLVILGSIAVVIFSVVILSLLVVVRSQREEIAELKEDVQYFESRHAIDLERMDFVRTKAEVEIAEHVLAKQDAYACLEMAMNDINSPVNNVSVEVGLHGVTYQFHTLEKEVV